MKRVWEWEDERLSGCEDVRVCGPHSVSVRKRGCVGVRMR